MKIIYFLGASLLTGFFGADLQAQVAMPSTFANISIDGDFTDWAGVPLAYTVPVGSSAAIQYDNVYIANNADDLFIRFTLYSPRPDALANSFDNIFIDADNNPLTGDKVGGIGSEMLIQNGSGYQERGGGFNEGNVNNLGWSIVGSADSTDFELEISRSAAYASDNTAVFANSTIAILLEGDDTGFNNTEFAPSSGGFTYTFAAAPVPEPSIVGLTLVGFCSLIMSRRLIGHRKIR